MPKRIFTKQGGIPLKELAEELGVNQPQTGTPVQSQTSRAAFVKKRGEVILKELGLESSSRLALGRLVLSVTPDIQSLPGLKEMLPFVHPNPHPRVSLVRAKGSSFMPVKFAQEGYLYTQRPTTSKQQLEGAGHLKLFSSTSTPPFYTVRLIVDPETPAAKDMIRESKELSWELSCKSKTLKPNAILHSLDIPTEYTEGHIRNLNERIDYTPVTFILGAVSLGYNYVRPKIVS